MSSAIASGRRSCEPRTRLRWAKLAPKTRAVLALPKAEQKKVVGERRKLLAAREAAKKAAG